MLRTLGGVVATGLSVSLSPKAKAAKAPDPSDSGIGTTWWTELVASDLGKAAQFYSSVMGWTTKTVAMADSSRPPKTGEAAYLLFLTSNSEVAGGMLASPDAPGKTKPTWVVYFQVPDVDAAVAKAIASGGALLIPPFEVPGSARLAVVADTDGIAVGLAAPL